MARKSVEIKLRHSIRNYFLSTVLERDESHSVILSCENLPLLLQRLAICQDPGSLRSVTVEFRSEVNSGLFVSQDRRLLD